MINNNNNLKQHTEVLEKTLLGDRAVDFEFREPFIVSGYRRPGFSFKQCIHSAFYAHNETINVWSHILALVGFLYHCLPVFCLRSNPFTDPFVYPLLSFSLGISAMFLMSSSAHLFNCMSAKVRHICFFFDYAAISTYTFTAGLVFYYYSRPTNTDLKLMNSNCLFLCISAAISLATTYLCCASRHKWVQHKFLLRTGTFVISWLFNTLPFTTRAIYCDSKLECNTVAFAYFKRQVFYFFLAALSNVIRIPERFIPGLFDFFGQSHHFLHILCSLGAIDDFVAVELDMNIRREILHASSTVLPTFGNSLGLMIAVLLGNIAIVIWFAVHCPVSLQIDKQLKTK
ncbi:predicted protein [Nematostella vectensis]|uniref:Uncharacterized protein n=1 Tax=Nematostella vectensis TaxID=45351 RepID=A7REV2_NEMVE|nr:predicted protein [Nematostella vectensis]|eukprot:XP_001641914.1 predicted protein [Nematostella vectensis]